MKHPVYPFSAVLRARRNEARLTPEDVAERTSYPKYKRWESGRTAVKPEYLGLLGEALQVGDELWALLYAWLLDHLTPPAGRPPVQVQDRLAELVAQLPAVEADLGALGLGAGPPLTHGELAAACLAARYGPGPAAAGEPIVLRGQRCSPLPSPLPPAGRLSALYGDVLGDWLAATGLAGMLAGAGHLGPAAQEAAAAQALQLMLAPGGLDQIAALLGAVPPTGSERGIARVPAAAGSGTEEIMALLGRAVDDLRRVQAAAARRPMSEAEFASTLLGLLAAGPEAFLAEDCPIDVSRLPDLDDTLATAGRELFDRMERTLRDGIAEELADAAATASPAAAAEAIIRVRRDHP